MPRPTKADQATALYAQMLGGAGNYGQQDEALAALIGAGVPIPPPVLGAVLQGRGNRHQRNELINQIGAARYGGYRGGRQAKPHFGPLSGRGPGEITLTDHDSGETFTESSVNPQDAAELANRELMESELLMQQRAAALGRMATGDDPADARQGREQLGIAVPDQAGAADFSGMMLGLRSSLDGGPEPLTPEGMSARADAVISSADPGVAEVFSQSYIDRQRPKVYQAASDFIKISELMGDPSVTQEDVARMMQQWEQTYGNTLSARPQAISPQQAAQLRDELQLRQISDEAGGIPIVRDAKGQPVVNPGWKARTDAELEQQRLAADQAAAQRDVAESRLRARMAALRGIKPTAGEPDFDAKNAAYQQALVTATNEYMNATAAPAPTPRPVTPPPAAPAAVPSFTSGDDAERAFDSGQIKPDQPFTVNGVRVAFDETGEPYRIGD